MTTEQKQEVAGLLRAEVERLGSQRKAATKVGVSDAYVSQMLNGEWSAISEASWTRVSAALGWRSGAWVVADTMNTRLVWTWLRDAKEHSLFMPIAHRAGSGKTESLRAYERANVGADVFYLSCREWAKREFLVQLAQTLGIEAAGRAVTVDVLLMGVVTFFQARQARRPLLILDEADKLKGAALRSLITLYNECEGHLGVVIAGTDHLEKQMRADARYNRKGADELMSRFGRNFQHLVGARKEDVRAMAEANGLTDKRAIEGIFRECEPVRRMMGTASVEVVEDLRRVKRAIIRDAMKGGGSREMGVGSREQSVESRE